ncbi:MAG: tyrosine-type recombinase/integrase [Steroidobacteraceae bacterium]|nr:tyrosine-type recombinase/integrase [Steroidobacteraceae bacterium]MBP7013253.1 tyrosine-type recombinase/integrase [Steroidobacteraceae bacterium]
MNTLQSALRDYVMLRRALGFKFREQEQSLTQFVSFLNARGARCITTPLALEWAVQPAQAKPARWAQRLSYIRGFARHLQAEYPDTQPPSTQLIPARFMRAKPYLYTEEEIGRLMAAAKELSPGNRLPGLSYYCLFGLLAVTGLRIGEALALRRDDVDLDNGVLTIRGTKFGKSRLVPLHLSTQRMLRRYARQRDAWIGGPRSPYFLVAKEGGRLWGPTVRVAFYDLSRQIGLRGQSDRTGPRLHDFRHRFAVETLLRWYRGGQNIETHLPALSTYLGHCSVQNTYWYLSACPQLMGAAAQRLEKRWEVRS